MIFNEKICTPVKAFVVMFYKHDVGESHESNNSRRLYLKKIWRYEKKAVVFA